MRDESNARLKYENIRSLNIIAEIMYVKKFEEIIILYL